MIKKISRQKASQQILDQIKQNIYDGTYPIGEKLPSENVLADAFGVSRVPIREALGVSAGICLKMHSSTARLNHGS